MLVLCGRADKFLLEVLWHLFFPLFPLLFLDGLLVLLENVSNSAKEKP
jgi:hypothetical protein